MQSLVPFFEEHMRDLSDSHVEAENFPWLGRSVPEGPPKTPF